VFLVLVTGFQKYFSEIGNSDWNMQLRWGENSVTSIAFVQAGIHSFLKCHQWQTGAAFYKKGWFPVLSDTVIYNTCDEIECQTHF